MNGRKHLPIIYALSLLLFFACKTPIPPDESMLIHQIKPSATDPTIDIADVAHYSGYSPGISQNNKLVLFLGGTASDASGYKSLLKTLIGAGYHVISLNYPNTNSVGGSAQNNLAEYGKIREEVVNGSDASTLVSVSANNSIYNRINKLLPYLIQNYSQEGWDTYYQGNTILWDKIIMAGYSQGSGHAAYIAKQHSVYRVVLFSGVVDGRIESPYESADWITETETNWETKFNEFRFFISTNDGFYEMIKANLATFGFPVTNPSTTVDVDQVNYASTGKWVFLTSVVSGSNAHASTCEDAAIPKQNDVPVYTNVWIDLFSGL